MPLTRLIIKNFKSIKNCDISLSELNVLIGENGTGKTNLLDAISYFYRNLTDSDISEHVFDENNHYSNELRITLVYDLSQFVKISKSNSGELPDIFEDQFVEKTKYGGYYKTIISMASKSKDKKLCVELSQIKGRPIRFFLRIDIASFFPSISDSCIKNELSNLLTCDSDDGKDKLLDLICDIVTLEDKLPQGACTSPTVSNLVMARIDQRITKYCQVFNIRYTRYADDLLFSSRIFNFAEKKWFIKKIKYILSSQKLKLNYSKIKFGQKELVLNGYVISDREIRLSRNRLSDIRRIVKFSKENHHLIDQFGPEKFILEANKLPLKYRNLNVYPFGTVFQFVQYMCGYRAFLISMTNNNYTLTPFQKELQRLIRRIEAQITRLI